MSLVQKVTSKAVAPLSQIEVNLGDLIHSIKNELTHQIDASHEALRAEIGVQSRLIGELRAEIASLRSELA